MKFLTKLIGASCIVPAVILGVSAFERRQIKIQDYTILSPKLPGELEGMKFVFLSDLHNACFGKENERLIRAIRNIRPDYVLVGGDMFVAKPGQTTQAALSLLKKLAKEFRVVCANGNHEFRMKIYPEQYGGQYRNYVKELKKAGVSYLENETMVLEKNGAGILVTGLEIGRDYYRRGKVETMEVSYLNEVLGVKEEERFCILLAHNPIYFSEYVEWGADLILSGHNHGGLIRIPFLGGLVSPQLTLFPQYDAGLYEKEDSHMIISRGLGTHTFPIRIRNYPELSVITLYRKNGKTE